MCKFIIAKTGAQCKNAPQSPFCHLRSHRIGINAAAAQTIDDPATTIDDPATIIDDPAPSVDNPATTIDEFLKTFPKEGPVLRGTATLRELQKIFSPKYGRVNGEYGMEYYIGVRVDGVDYDEHYENWIQIIHTDRTKNTREFELSWIMR